ncbi:MAG: ATP-binding protein [Desulfurivibrionaceae bacterium]|jgi:NAD-dependent dihydropyrimidine dehydrogenase PreA subunit|nr:4Fe-4S ferredoxin [Pseudomonadota bacterium]MCG2822654.1 4Fe-4S ferredoxin [Desulfobulbaceae bacterium]MDP2002167.1 4Fe-4S ferredoxin [Desulfurivibrionaceae bacterium]MDP2758087.1 4Fe-4S ferredoxin [Desulfurivibrionaceae bacterium]
MKILRKIIEIDENLCTGCGECIINCAEGALQIVDGKARMLAEKYCDGLGACLGHCPTGALRIIEREAEDFDEEAVEELLKNRNAPQAHPAPPVGGCPSARLQTFAPATPCQAANAPVQLAAASGSALSHWPVQIRLVPPSAPFLKDADLLIAADCVPVAYPDFHRNLLSGKVVMVGCPKFDEAESAIAKFAEIFASSGIKSITMAIMEVPCCSNMRHIVSQALSRSGTAIPVREVVISARGELLRQGEMPS